MKITRARRRQNFTVIPNEAIDDERMSFRARGLLAYLLSRPDGWTTSAERLASVATEGRDAVRTALREIEDAGYLRRTVSRVGGRFASDWQVVDEPERETSDGEPGESENTPERETSDGDRPIIGLPSLENRCGSTDAVFQASLIKTDTKNGNKELLTPVAPAGFAEFWATYPRKVGKPKAAVAFAKACSRADPASVIDGAERYAADPNRLDEFTAHPTTWLNRDGWNDAPLPERRSNLQPVPSRPWSPRPGTPLSYVEM